MSADDPLRWPEEEPVPDRLADPTPTDQVLALVCAGSMWLLPVIGPLVVRLFLRDRPFALHWFRLSLIVQLVYVGLFLMGVFLAQSGSLGQVPAAVSVLAWVWAVYASVSSLIHIVRRRAVTVPPVPAALLQRA